MRIGLFTDQYYPSISGVVTSIKMLYEGLTDLGHECFIFTSYDEKKALPNEELLGKNIINIPGRPYPFKNLRDYRYSFTHRRFLKYVEECNLDIIHVHTEYNIAKLARLASKKFSIPLVHTLHTLWSDYFKYVSPFFDKHAHKQMEKLLRGLFLNPVSKQSCIEIVPTKKVLDQKEIYGLGDDVRVIPTGIDINRFNQNNFSKDEILSLKHRLGIKDDQFVFLYIGRTSKEKSISVLLKSYANACKDNDNAVFLIVGGGPELDELKELANKLGINKHVIFTNLISWEEIPKYYQLGDIFLNASQTETQGLTYIEALASSVPILIQRDDCVSFIVDDYYNGIFFDGEDDLALKMKEILRAPDTLKKIKANTSKSIEKYSKENYSQNVLEIYNEAIEKFKLNNRKALK